MRLASGGFDFGFRIKSSRREPRQITSCWEESCYWRDRCALVAGGGIGVTGVRSLLRMIRASVDLLICPTIDRALPTTGKNGQSGLVTDQASLRE